MIDYKKILAELKSIEQNLGNINFTDWDIDNNTLKAYYKIGHAIVDLEEFMDNFYNGRTTEGR